MLNEDLLYQLSLTLVPNIGHVHARILLQHFNNAQSIFRASASALEKIEGIGSVRARSIRSFSDFGKAAQEIRFMEKSGIRALFITDDAYPKRLLHCNDAPAMLFYKGNANLNAAKILAVVGTRRNTEYGRRMTAQLVEQLGRHDITIISGLAYGIDAIAHQCALRHNKPTIGVLGHGLDQVYPPAHYGLAKEMLQQGGGLLTEFRSGIAPDKHNFPGRNRIVAGMSDATILIETDTKGGSMITAEIAGSYNRDVFAIPGRVSDNKSCGCNYLIRSNKAILLTHADELIDAMGWHDKPAPAKRQQKLLFPELGEEEKKISELLNETASTAIDDLYLKSGLSASTVAGALLQLELKGVIMSLPGKRYRLV